MSVPQTYMTASTQELCLLLVRPLPQEHFDSSTLLTLTPRSRGTDVQERCLDPDTWHSLTSRYCSLRGQSGVIPAAFDPQVRRRDRNNWAFYPQRALQPMTTWPQILRTCHWEFVTILLKQKKTKDSILRDLSSVPVLLSRIFFCLSRKNWQDEHFIQLVCEELAVFTSYRSLFCSFNRYIMKDVSAVFNVLFL